MKMKFIKIKEINDLNSFIQQANLVQGDILAKRGKFVVDAKSLLGIMSINISEGCTICYPNEATNFEKFLSSFE